MMVAALIIELLSLFGVLVLTRLFYLLFGLIELPVGSGLMIFLSFAVSVIIVGIFFLLEWMRKRKKRK